MRHVKLFEAFDGGRKDPMGMTSLQFKRLMDFLESDGSVLNPDDVEYYSEATGIDDVGTMMDMYAGHASHKHEKTEGMKEKYLAGKGKTWEQVCKEADDEE